MQSNELPFNLTESLPHDRATNLLLIAVDENCPVEQITMKMCD